LTSIEDLWIDLADVPAGQIAKRLIDANWPGDLEAVVLKPGDLPGLRLTLTDPVDVDTSDLQQSESVDLRVEAVGNGIGMVQISLLDNEFRDLFQSLCSDLVRRVLETPSEEAGAQTLVRNLGRWLRMMKRKGIGALSREKQIGLYGELLVLSYMLAPAVGWGEAVQGWTGPSGGFQDFQLAGLGIESKTLSASRPQTLKISSERQLDNNGLSALLIAHMAVDLVQGSGQTLPDLVDAVRGELGDGGLRELFDSRLFEVGYLDIHAAVYVAHGYTQRSLTWYHVTPGFPSLTERDLRPGLGRVQYVLDASACAPFTVAEETVRSWLDAPPTPSHLVGADESQVFECKATAWKSVENEQTPDRVISGIIVKTVVGFLNADGGTLVIGVADRAKPEEEISGIEVDLEHLGIDIDAYEVKLNTLLREYIGGPAIANIRIDFRPHLSKTMCLVHVRASTRPVFGRLPSKGEKGEHFFVRQGNSTVELTGSDAFDYMRAHFG